MELPLQNKALFHLHEGSGQKIHQGIYATDLQLLDLFIPRNHPVNRFPFPELKTVCKQGLFIVLSVKRNPGKIR